MSGPYRQRTIRDRCDTRYVQRHSANIIHIGQSARHIRPTHTAPDKPRLCRIVHVHSHELAHRQRSSSSRSHLQQCRRRTGLQRHRRHRRSTRALGRCTRRNLQQIHLLRPCRQRNLQLPPALEVERYSRLDLASCLQLSRRRRARPHRLNLRPALARETRNPSQVNPGRGRRTQHKCPTLRWIEDRESSRLRRRPNHGSKVCSHPPHHRGHRIHHIAHSSPASW
jgi:hypothetical protein